MINLDIHQTSKKKSYYHVITQNIGQTMSEENNRSISASIADQTTEHYLEYALI
jgi:hypothetical protein